MPNSFLVAEKVSLSADIQQVEPELRSTDDASPTLFSQQFGECYHSVFGARTESEYIFIHNGLNRFRPSAETFPSSPAAQPIRVLEVGLGTGLNLALSVLHAAGRIIDYHAVELYPIAEQQMTDYISQSPVDLRGLLSRIFFAPWGEKFALSEQVTLTKHLADIASVDLPSAIDVVFFDAFSPDRQPEMWTDDVFERIYSSQSAGGLLVTYCSKGVVKCALRAVGYEVSRLQGPPHKRHILLAVKK